MVSSAKVHPLSGALRFCDVPGGGTFTDTEFYNEFFVPFGLRYQMVMQLPAPPDVIVGYALNRGPGAGEFSDRDVAVLNALGPTWRCTTATPSTSNANVLWPTKSTDMAVGR